MHVFQLVLSLQPGGTERLVIEITRRVREFATVEALCLDERGEWARELDQLGVDVTVLGRRPGLDLRLPRQIARRLRRAPAPTVLHCHHYTPFVYGALALAGAPRTRLVYTEHGRLSDRPPSSKRRVANAIFTRVPGRVFAVSADLREHMIGEGLAPSKVEVCHNGIAPGDATTQAGRDRARGGLAIPEGSIAAVTVARLMPVKDLLTLLRGFAVARERERRLHLIVVGDGPDRPALEALAGELGIARSVSFLGHRDDARALLPGMDLYVNTSIIEGISVTILEAMAAGLPVVATAVGGNPEVVAAGETGLLVPSRDPERLAAALVEYAGDAGLRARHGAAGRARLERDFSLERMVGRYVEAYRGSRPPGETTGP